AEEELKKANLLIEELLKAIEEESIKLRKQLCDRFGIKSDKNEVVNATEVEETASIKYKKERKKSRKKRGRKKGTKDACTFDESIVKKEIVYIDNKDSICSECGSTLIEKNESIFYKVDIVPQTVKLTEYHIKNKFCPNCGNKPETYQINEFDNESFATPSLAAFTINAKYNYALPLYRQEQILDQLGAKISRVQLADYSIETAELLTPIYDRLKELLINTNVKVLHADETTLQVLHKADKDRMKCYMWVYSTTLYDNQIRIYDYQADRKAIHPADFLKGYDGYLVCDDYLGYNNINNVKLCRCWFHAKKKYADNIKSMSSKATQKSETLKIHNMIVDIFKVNNKIESYKNATPIKIKEERDKEVKPLVDKYFKYIEDLTNNGLDMESSLGKAIKYSLNIKDDLYRFLEDGHIPMTNNLAERTVKPFVILRKNCLFNNTENGAVASAILMSIVQTAKMNLLQPDKYIAWLIENISTTSQKDIDNLLPFSKNNIPRELYYKKANS
ncbi:MAG: IS66 family transposase, partial [Bacilli bacterium]